MRSSSDAASHVEGEKIGAKAQTVKVLCVDDNYLVAEGVAVILRRTAHLEWGGQLSTANDLVRETRERGIDVVLLDIDLPGRDPFEALRELAAACPNVRTIMFSGYINGDYIDRAVESGAWGYLAKGESANSVIDAIERVIHGEFVLGPDVQSLYSGKRPPRMSGE